MSYGNKNTQGNRKTNFQWQYAMIKVMNKILNVNGGPASDLKILESTANDLVKDLTYADPNDLALRRVTSIVYSSASLGLTVTETFTYVLSSAGDYYVTQITLS